MTAQPQKTIEMIKLYRDLDGYVHTCSGFLSKDAYERVRLAHPELNLPAHAELPPLNS